MDKGLGAGIVERAAFFKERKLLVYLPAVERISFLGGVLTAAVWMAKGRKHR